MYGQRILTGEKGLKQVVRTFVNEKDVLIQITVNGTLIEATENHPFWVEGEGWVDACNLKSGDILRLESGENVEISDLKRVELDSPINVYNFEVQDWHTYFVSEDGVLVHNDCFTNSQARSSAKNLGFSEVKNQYSHGQLVF
ncbi:MAG: polymorphic toxin-type HINT domain-containing protein, partial [Bacillota bacterium]